jgi:hypothetical protein
MFRRGFGFLRRKAIAASDKISLLTPPFHGSYILGPQFRELATHLSWRMVPGEHIEILSFFLRVLCDLKGRFSPFF